MPDPHRGGDEPTSLPRQVLLVVDDEVDIRESLKDLFEGGLEGVDVKLAESGPEALAMLADVDVDAIVTDYRMPGMSGLEFLAEARRIAPDIPAILITAYPDLDLAIRAVNEARVTSFFTKPLEPVTVLDVVRRALDDRRADDLRNRAFARSLDLLRREMRGH
ncbi:MAG TPA: response regulator [Candidatus Thermoplasmatota archaeon]|nr:response regulator [Candidatus Thermoplasmatota archaeon]